MIVVSSCIAGVKCRYNATSSYKAALIENIEANHISICPEIIAGFKIPRTACEIVGGKW